MTTKFSELAAAHAGAMRGGRVRSLGGLWRISGTRGPSQAPKMTTFVTPPPRPGLRLGGEPRELLLPYLPAMPAGFCWANRQTLAIVITAPTMQGAARIIADPVVVH